MERTSTDDIDGIVHRIKAEFEEPWRLLKAAATVVKVQPPAVKAGDDPMQYISDRYLGDPIELLRIVQHVAAPIVRDSRESLLALAVEVCRAVPRHIEKLDTFSDEEKQLAIRSVKEQLPEAWARLVRMQGRRPLPDDEELWGTNDVEISKLLERLPIQWVPGSFNESGPKLIQRGILYRHVVEGARRNSRD